MRRSFLICGLVVMAGLVWYFLRPEPTDDTLIANWRANRPAFDQLVQMYLADDLDQSIYPNGDYNVFPAYPGPPTPILTFTPVPPPNPYPGPGYPAPEAVASTTTSTIAPTPVGVSDARRQEYVALLQSIGVMSFGDRQRDYAGPHRLVIFLVAYDTSIREIIWAKEPLGVGQGLVDQTRCRQLEANWYFCSRLQSPD